MSKLLLVFIGRVIHIKTKSDEYFISLLEEFFDVVVVRREAQPAKVLVKEINALNPDIVFFHALPPSISRNLMRLKCKQLVWAPMWDGFRQLSLKKRLAYRFFKLKIVTFSKALYAYMKSIRLQVQYWQRFIEPALQHASRKTKPPYVVLLWQREEKLGIDQVVQLLGEKNIKKIIHKSESFQNYASYSFEIERMEGWLPKDVYFNKMIEADIVIAPRFVEGIGFSFLEPMAMGKIIVAYDNATMNEYIIDGENGYLFSENFRPIELLKTPNEMYPKIAHYVDYYFKQWESSKKELEKFIVSTVDVTK